jgi:hypothetical protein
MNQTKPMNKHFILSFRKAIHSIMICNNCLSSITIELGAILKKKKEKERERLTETKLAPIQLN